MVYILDSVPYAERQWDDNCASHKRRKLEELRLILLREKVIDVKHNVKYVLIGLILDSKLLWNKHGEIIVKKATYALKICKDLTGTACGYKS